MIDFKKIYDAFRLHDAAEFIDALGGNEIADPNQARRIVTVLRESGSLVIPIEDGAKETHRDKLIATCREVIGACRDVRVREDFENHVSDARVAERGYRELFRSLRNSDIWKCSPEEQAWGMLLRADREFAHVEEEIQKQMLKFAGKSGPSSPFDPRQLKLHDENDKPVSPDAIVNGIVRNASDTLVMLAYIHRWFDGDGSIVLPTDVSVDDKIAFKAGMYSLAACQWRYLTDAWDQSRLFGVRLRLRDQEFQVKQGGTRQCTLLEVQNSGELELMDRIALNRVEQAFFEVQMGFEIIAGNASRAEEKQRGTAPLPKAGYLTPEERGSSEILDSSYCISIDDESIVIGGLRIKVWLRGYAYFGKKARDADGNPRFTSVRVVKDELLSELQAVGLSKAEAQTFIEFTTFGRGITDLFDAPLLKIADGSYLFFAGAYQTPVLGVILLSRLSALRRHRDGDGQVAVEYLFEDKGTLFEQRILEIFRVAGIEASGFKYKVDGVEFDCDVAALLDDTLFVFECKNRSLPMGHIPSLYYFDLAAREAQEQVKRTVRHFTVHPDIVSEHFGKAVKWKRIVPVVLHALPWSLGLRNGVYLYDGPALAHLVNEGSTGFSAIAKVDIHHIIRRHRFALRKGAIPTADELEREMRNPYQLRMNKLGWEQLAEPIPVSSDFVFSLPHWVQHEISLQDQFIALGSSPEDAARMVKEMGEEFPRAVDEVRRRVDGHHVSRNIGRNSPCPCGSGRKFKRCCGGQSGQ